MENPIENNTQFHMITLRSDIQLYAPSYDPEFTNQID